MKRITKNDAKRKLELAEKLTVAENRLVAAIETYNHTVQNAWGEVDGAMNEYNELIQDANGFVVDIANEIESYMDERSDKWREGDTASSYEEWKSSWEQGFNEIDLDEPVDIATDFDESAADMLRDLEDEVSL